MVKSMTGYGKGRAMSLAGTFTAEIRSLNHKYFDLICRLPNNLSVFEDKVREHVKKQLRRGRINISLSWDKKKPTSAGFSLNLDMAKKYYSEMMKLKKTLKLKDDLKVAQIVAMPEVLIFEQQKEKVNHHWPQVRGAVDEALKKLSRMRSAEGKRLEKDLLDRIKKVNLYVGNIESQLPRVIKQYKENLLSKVKALTGTKKPDHDRIAEEVALFVRNSDVAEELTRLRSHIKAFKNTLRTQKEAGKESDFIAQEMFREANTIGAKANSFKISRWVIKMKSQIEKIREQLQNVE